MNFVEMTWCIISILQTPLKGEGGDESDDDDDSDDDGFKITIDKDKIEEAKTSYQTFGLNKPSARQIPAEKKGKFSVEEFDQVSVL
jgi:hypothetical protein